MYRLLTFLFAIMLLVQCAPDEESSTQPLTQKANVKIPAFNADSAYAYVARQVAFGPRVPNSPAHDSCAQWIVNVLAPSTKDIQVQGAVVTAFDGTRLNAKNIIASFNPEAKKRVLLCAHYDTRPFADRDTENKDKPILGANDGGSGVGILLEVARVIRNNPIELGVDIIFFDAEDYGKSEVQDSYCLGSQFWAKNRHKQNYYASYGILLDMVGAQDAEFRMEGTSRAFAPNVLRRVWDAGNSLGYSQYFLYEKSPPLTDDHYYINQIAGIPTIDIIQSDLTTSSGFGSYWHTHDDNMDIIDKATLKAVGQTVVAMIYADNAAL